RLVVLRMRNNKMLCVGGSRCFANLVRRRIQPPELDIAKDRIVKQKRLLSYEPDPFPQRFLRERENRALSCAAGADQSVGFTGLDMQSQVANRIRNSGGITEGHIFKIKPT